MASPGGEGMFFVVSKLSVYRLAPKIVEQMELGPRDSLLKCDCCGSLRKCPACRRSVRFWRGSSSPSAIAASTD